MFDHIEGSDIEHDGYFARYVEQDEDYEQAMVENYLHDKEDSQKSE